MKSINNFLIERLKLTKNSKLDNLYSFKKVDNPQQLFGYNWILSDEYYHICPILLQWALKKCVLTNREETFINNFLDDLIKNKRKGTNKKIEILNGQKNNGYYMRPKCIYDICKLLSKTKEAEIMVDENNKSITWEIYYIIHILNNVTNNSMDQLDWVH